MQQISDQNMYRTGAKFVHGVPFSCPMTLLEWDAEHYFTPLSSKWNISND